MTALTYPPAPDDPGDTPGQPVTNDHYPGLRGAHLMPTRASRFTHDHLDAVIAHRTIACIHGDPGQGKTLAVNVALRTLAPAGAVRLQIPNPTVTKIRTILLHRLDPDSEHTHRADKADAHLTDLLARTPHVLVFDEAQRLSGQCLDYLSTLWDDDSTRFALVFVGAENTRLRISRRPALASRVERWQHYQRLTLKELFTHIPSYHPVWKNTAPAVIQRIDTKAAHGNWRHWARITLALQDHLAKHPDDEITMELLRDLLDPLFDGEDDTGWTDPDDLR